MESNEKPYWHTTRLHDELCAARRVAAAKDQKPAPPCIPGCRVGQPWPTLRLLPEQLRKLRLNGHFPEPDHG
jgi:hypothetical protein